MIAALFVARYGPYWNNPMFDAWDEERDARKYKGPYKVIAHPPCERWGRYWGGGPMLHGTPKQKKLGDDNGCFEAAFEAVNKFGGVIEHPEASHAWNHFGITKPPRNGGWVDAGYSGAYTCCVAQGNYGHRAQKLTWLYAVDSSLPELKWGLTPGKQRLEDGAHSKEHRKNGLVVKRERISCQERIATPKEFMELLVRIVK